MSAHQVEDHGLLRFLTCGSVDDGKSTLIGRLLFDTKTILADQLDTLERRAAGSQRQGHQPRPRQRPGRRLAGPPDPHRQDHTRHG